MRKLKQIPVNKPSGVIRQAGFQNTANKMSDDNQRLYFAALKMLADTKSPFWKSFFDAWLTLAISRSSDEEVEEYQVLISSSDFGSLWKRISSKVQVQDQRNIANIVGSKFVEIVAAKQKEVGR